MLVYGSTRATPWTASPPRALTYDTAVLFGDSLTEFGGSSSSGWAAQLTANYTRKLDVLNRGFRGYNSLWLKKAVKPLLQAIPTDHIRLFTLMIGTNDYVPKHIRNQHVPLEEYKQNLRDILEIFRTAAPNAHVLLMTPPPISNTTALWGGAYSFTSAQLYRDACVLVAEETSKTSWGKTHLTLLNTWDVLVPAGSVEYDSPSFDPTSIDHLFVDKLHFNAVGNAVLFEGIMQRIRDVWPELAEDRMVPVLPVAWREAPAASSGDEAGIRKWLFQNTRQQTRP
ncbi:hypothetical protein HDU98_010230 [Podochytrium sp. JEL0797]|nr:hypothetical protein HDU98_010230 [Podochytrium sp. JEL0797]